MGDNNSKQKFFSNRELYCMQQDLAKKIQDLRIEIVKTTKQIERYNGLRQNQNEVIEEQQELKSRINKIENTAKQSIKTKDRIKNNIGWIIALILSIAKTLEIFL